jgi:sugar lactone lactonase YvrE
VRGQLVTADFDQVWAVDAKGTRTLLAGPDAFPAPPLFLNDVFVETDGRTILVTDMGDVSKMTSSDGAFWPLDSDQAKNLTPRGRVYRITLNGQVSVVIDHASEMPDPNGVDELDDGTILVDEFFRGTLLAWKAGRWRTISDDHRSADGIVHDRSGKNYYATEVRTGRVWSIEAATGEKHLLAKLESAADLYLDEPNHQLIVPDSKAGKLVFIPLPHSAR